MTTLKPYGCFLNGEWVTAISSDRCKHIWCKTKEGKNRVTRACDLEGAHIQKYSQKFSAKLLAKLPYDKDFWYRFDEEDYT